MSSNKKAVWTPQGVTTKFSLGGLGNLINPLSALYKQTQDYVPEAWLKAFMPGGKDIQANKRGAQVAHVLAKVLAGGATFAGAAWMLRSFLHSLNIDNVQNIKSSARASRKLDTIKSRPVAPVITGNVPGKPSLPEVSEEEGMEKTQGLVYDMSKAALPAAAVVAATLATFKLADKHYDTQLGSRLDNELSAAKSESQDLALKRILRTRGLEQPEPEDTEVADTYNEQLKNKAKSRPRKGAVKTASLNKKAEPNLLPGGIQSSLGLLALVTLFLGGAAGFGIQRANSSNLAEYKAYKQGLETYNKQRVLSEPIESTPLDPEFLDYLDTNLAAAKKKAPAAPVENSLKEIMV